MALSAEAKRLLALRDRLEGFPGGADWVEIGIITGYSQIINGHSRLLRSQSFGDSDYGSCILDVLNRINQNDPGQLSTIEDYLNQHVDGGGTNIGAAHNTGPKFYISPTAFNIPDTGTEHNLMSAMMPFDRQFDGVYATIGRVASSNFMVAQRADNVWQHSTIIQDVFSLIFRSSIVICDFSGKNPNVFYEAGIAHTLGKHVIPIAQHISELPFDLQHHRAIIYQNNNEGLSTLERKLNERVAYLLSLT